MGFAAVFTDITRRGTLPEEVSIHIAVMMAIKIALERDPQKMNNVYTLRALCSPSDTI